MTSFRPARVRPVPGLLLLLACCPGLLLAAPMPERLTSAPFDSGAAWDYRFDGRGGLWLAYYAAAGSLQIRKPDGQEQPAGAQGAGEARSGLTLAALDADVAVLWRDKLPSKALYLARGTDLEPPPVELGDGTQPLRRIVALASDNDLDVLWLGEQPVAGADTVHHIYHRRVHLPTNEASPVERLFPGIYPTGATNAEGALMTVSWESDAQADTGRIVARMRPSGSAAFTEPVTVATVGGIAGTLRAAHSGDRWLVFWVTNETGAAEDLVLEGAYSDNAGAGWKRFTFDKLRGMSLSSLDIAAAPPGHLALAITARRLDTNPPSKETVYLLRSTDGGSTWMPPRPLRTLKHAEQFRARHASLDFGSKPGSLLVVWEDWREIRSRLYASFSSDYGATWQYENVPLPHAPDMNVGLRADVSAVVFDEDRFQVFAEQYVDDAVRQKHLVRLSLSLEDMARLASAAQQRGGPRDDLGSGTTADEPDQAHPELRRRVAAFWEAMINKEYGDAYAFYDPFFRSRVAVTEFLPLMGRINYASSSIEDVAVTGARAEVKSRVRASIGPFKAPTTGETISRPEQEVTMTETWLWVDDNWYREFRSEAYETAFTLY